MKSIKPPLLKSRSSSVIALIFILTIPSALSMQVRFQMSSFRIAIIFVGFMKESFSLIISLHFGSRSSISIFIWVVCFCIGVGCAGLVVPDFDTEIMLSWIFGSDHGCPKAAILFSFGRKKSS